jgi:hypothetical protein
MENRLHVMEEIRKLEKELEAFEHGQKEEQRENV